MDVAREEQGNQVATFLDSAEMIEAGIIDLAIVIVPHRYHAPVAKTLLEAGIHVITEKPFTVRVSEADELINLAKQNGVMVSVYHTRHWDTDIMSLKELIKRGAIGELYSVECNMVNYGLPGQAWRTDKSISGGLLYDLSLIHI